MTHGSLALKLRVLRAERALTIEQAAARAGVMPETISDAERGRRHPYVPTLRKIAEGYGVPIEELLAQESGEEPLLAGAGQGKGKAPQETGPSEAQDERSEASIHIDYAACRRALEAFCDHWGPALSGKRNLELQAFQDFKADATSLSRFAREVMGAETTVLGQQYDEEGDPLFYTEYSEFGPALARFHDLIIRMERVGRERFGEDLRSDPEMGQLIEMFPKAG